MDRWFEARLPDGTRVFRSRVDVVPAHATDWSGDSLDVVGLAIVDATGERLVGLAPDEARKVGGLLIELADKVESGVAVDER